MTFDQSEFAVRCEWGSNGLQTLAPISDVVVIVDVLSFSTSVDIAVEQGGIVFPYPYKNASAAEFARSIDAHLASSERDVRCSLSPASLQRLPTDYRLVLPSPNGAALSFSANHSTVLTACLRNATAVARAASGLGRSFAVIAAGESWEDGKLRPCFEDWIGAGAVIDQLPGDRSPEALLAVAGFNQLRGRLKECLRTCVSGKELIERGFEKDVELAAECNVSRNVPRLSARAFQQFSTDSAARS